MSDWMYWIFIARGDLPQTIFYFCNFFKCIRKNGFCMCVSGFERDSKTLALKRLYIFEKFVPKLIINLWEYLKINVVNVGYVENVVTLY